MKHSLIALSAVLAAGGIFAIAKLCKPASVQRKPTVVETARVDRSHADPLYGTPAAKEAYKSFVQKWKASPDKKVQDEVGAARLRLANMQAREKDFTGARQTLRETVAEYKGSGSMAADFGGVKDQALYQSAVCLSAEGKTAEARKALVDFIKTQPMSPLVNAAYKRIVRIDGKATPEVDRLMQTAVDIQEKRIRFETSVCGPKALVYLLKLTGKGDFDYQALAKECGTTEKGTTIDGLRKCLHAHGLEYYGFQVAKKDIPKIELPAIFYTGDHYLVVTKVDAKAMTVHDPATDRDGSIPFASDSNPDYSAVLLLKSAPKVEAN